MDNLAGIAITIINGLVLFILIDMRNAQKEEKKDRQSLRDEIREDAKDMWHRIYNHRHVVKCGSKDCTDVETSEVIIPQEFK